MLNYIIIFFLLAILASFLGFGALAGTFALIAKVFAIIFLILFIVSLIRHFAKSKNPPTL